MQPSTTQAARPSLTVAALALKAVIAWTLIGIEISSAINAMLGSKIVRLTTFKLVFLPQQIDKLVLQSNLTLGNKTSALTFKSTWRSRIFAYGGKQPYYTMIQGLAGCFRLRYVEVFEIDGLPQLVENTDIHHECISFEDYRVISNFIVRPFEHSVNGWGWRFTGTATESCSNFAEKAHGRDRLYPAWREISSCFIIIYIIGASSSRLCSGL